MNDAAEVFQPLQADDPALVAGYRLAARLGAGGMGRVYLSHTQGGRPVAIKVVRPELADDPDFRRRFRREIAAARRVRGAYTAELIDADADGVPPWLATLYVPGPSLTEAVARRGPLPVPAVLWLMAGVAEALQAIHGVGIVHRDLKPSNVLLAADGPRVIDFGISLASDATSHTATGGAIGTPAFMAPEQASAGEVTAATDIFALGQTAAFAALGEPLYGDGPAVNVLYRIVHSEPDLSRLPAELCPLIARCLAADPAERATPAEVVEWCRERLGPDAEEGAGPTVWRELAGQEVTVPPPVPDPPVPALAQVHTLPLVTQPQPGWQQPAWPTGSVGSASAGPDERRARRRRAAWITAGVVTAAVALLLGSTWILIDAADGLRHRHTTASSTSGPAPTAQSSASSSTSAPSSGEGTDVQAPGVSGPSPSFAGPTTPEAVAYPVEYLNEKNSVSIEEPVDHRDRKGDIRLVCGAIECALESRTSVMTPLFGEPRASYDECSRILRDGKSHHLPLAAVAAGSEICVKHSSGDIALIVIQVKSTIRPQDGAAFVMADMTVWRDA
ncbi:serine/threonine-protein kinase [Streptomyces sp. NPDC046805]|uniref:serine/threonine-protein kinase n=1 Tax=Streptomyces sp. NPDC046805 TaxID=3155134 RepID=UPI0033D0FCC4